MCVKDLIALLQKCDQESLIKGTWEGITRPIKAIWIAKEHYSEAHSSPSAIEHHTVLLDVDEGNYDATIMHGVIWTRGCPHNDY